jgi:mono/diheme cytochrome c family protein
MFKKAVNVVEVLTLVATAAFLVLLFANEPSTGGRDNASPGATLFADNCARCHGADGGGGIGPQLSDGAVVERFPDEADQIQFVTRGGGSMPAFGGALSPAEIREIVTYTRTL